MIKSHITCLWISRGRKMASEMRSTLHKIQQLDEKTVREFPAAQPVEESVGKARVGKVIETWTPEEGN